MAVTDSDILQLKSKIRSLEIVVSELKDTLSTYETVSVAEQRETSLVAEIQEFNDSITDLQLRLAKVILPDNTRYYLSAQEVSAMRALVRDMQQLKAQLESALAVVLNKVQYLNNLAPQ